MKPIPFALFLLAGVFAVCELCAGDSTSGVQKMVVINTVDFDTDPTIVKMDVTLKPQPDGRTLVDLNGHLLEDLNTSIFVSVNIT